MAIRPVDLQMSFAAAPVNAAVLRNAEEAPAIAQAAQAAQFAAQSQKREETIEATTHATGDKVRPQGDEPDQQASQHDEYEQPHPSRSSDEPALGLAGDGQHFIDVTA
ncbi:MAG: hypothetical protein M3126_09410 [Candidatus Eremiobacteraeota bacterium]|nr:hypothetical protein [Candidatus Eremiobacteraeota bacterium]